MSEQLLKETRVELSYGLTYARKALQGGSTNLGIAEMKIVEARMGAGNALRYLTGKDVYPNASNPDNDVIERSTDIVPREEVTINERFDKVRHIKYLIRGLNLGLDKLVQLRMSRTPAGISPQQTYLYNRSLDRAIDSLEVAIGFLGGELRMIAETDPEGASKYPSEAPTHENAEPGAVKEDAKSTDQIMQDRAGSTAKDEEIKTEPEPTEEKEEELDPNRPLTGEDYLPGGRAYKEPAKEAAEVPDVEEEKRPDGSQKETITEAGAQADLDGQPRPEGNGSEGSENASPDSSQGDPEADEPTGSPV